MNKEQLKKEIEAVTKIVVKLGIDRTELKEGLNKLKKAIEESRKELHRLLSLVEKTDKHE